MRIYPYYVLVLVIGYKLWSIRQPAKKPISENHGQQLENPNPSFEPAAGSYFVVIGATAEPVYMFPLFLTVLAWKRLGVESIICFAASIETLQRNPATNYILERIKDQNASTLYLDTTLAPAHTISQTCRLFVTGSSDLDLPEDAVLMTSDSDLWPTNLANHVPRMGQEIFSYHSHCCGFTHKPWSLRWFRHYRMGTIAMRVSVWRDLMGITKGWLVTGDDIAKRLFSEFSEKYIRLGRGKPFISRSWFADQILLSDKLRTWIDKNGHERFGEIEQVLPEERLFRGEWPKRLANVDYRRYREIHLMNPLHEEENWSATLPVINSLFSEQERAEIDEYKKMTTWLIKEGL